VRAIFGLARQRALQPDAEKKRCRHLPTLALVDAFSCLVARAKLVLGSSAIYAANLYLFTEVLRLLDDSGSSAPLICFQRAESPNGNPEMGRGPGRRSVSLHYQTTR
jgi:hypothetical protein